MLSFLLTGAGACFAALLFVGQAIADRQQEEIRYAHDLALAVGGDYRCGYGLDMDAVRQAIEGRLASLPAAARRNFHATLEEVTANRSRPDGLTCESGRLLAGRLGLLDR